MEEITKEIKHQKIGSYKENINLKGYNTYRVEGKAKLLVYPKNTTKLIALIKLCKEHNLSYKILGNGSNIIFSDKPFNGVLIKLDELNKLTIEEDIVTVGAGYNLMKLAYLTAGKGLTGLEFASGIPGTVGGAIYMNAGAYKSDMGYVVSKVKLLTPSLEIMEMYNKDLDFHYRTSFLQKNPGFICLEATLVLKPGDKKAIMDLILERKQKRWISQPLEFPSAGSVFRNPENDFAGRLIEACGLKGHQIGGAKVSDKHANFIINTGNATGSDIKNLIDLIKQTVSKEMHVDLKAEQEFVNWE